MKRISVIFMGLMIIGFATVSQASVWTVNSYSAFLFYCDQISLDPLVENFEDVTLVPGLTITEVGGAGTIDFGVYQNIVDVDASRYQIFNFNSMYGFGGWFDLDGPGGPGTGINVFINDTNAFVMNIPSSANGQFYGLFSDDPFTGVRLEDANDTTHGGVQETYFTVDLAMCPVPIAPSVFMLGSGLLGLLGLRSRRKSI